jgi:hypothetical protein
MALTEMPGEEHSWENKIQKCLLGSPLQVKKMVS